MDRLRNAGLLTLLGITVFVLRADRLPAKETNVTEEANISQCLRAGAALAVIHIIIAPLLAHYVQCGGVSRMAVSLGLCGCVSVAAYLLQAFDAAIVEGSPSTGISNTFRAAAENLLWSVSFVLLSDAAPKKFSTLWLGLYNACVKLFYMMFNAIWDLRRDVERREDELRWLVVSFCFVMILSSCALIFCGIAKKALMSSVSRVEFLNAGWSPQRCKVLGPFLRAVCSFRCWLLVFMYVLYAAFSATRQESWSGYFRLEKVMGLDIDASVQSTLLRRIVSISAISVGTFMGGVALWHRETAERLAKDLQLYVVVRLTLLLSFPALIITIVSWWSYRPGEGAAAFGLSLLTGIVSNVASSLISVPSYICALRCVENQDRVFILMLIRGIVVSVGDSLGHIHYEFCRSHFTKTQHILAMYGLPQSLSLLALLALYRLVSADTLRGTLPISLRRGSGGMQGPPAKSRSRGVTL